MAGRGRGRGAAAAPRNIPPVGVQMPLPTLSSFMKQHPKTFEGVEDPHAAELWLADMEKIFKALRCTDEQKVEWAVYRLQGDATEWWNAFEASITPQEVAAITWEEFKELFLEQYFPDVAKERLAMEFIQMKQEENETVSDYQKRFDRLAKYAPEMIPNQRKKGSKFRMGLKPNLRRFTTGPHYDTYRTILEGAQAMEADSLMFKEQRTSQAQTQKKRPAEGQRGEASSGGKRSRESEVVSNANPRPACAKCGKNHGGECRAIICQRCGKPGHITRFCHNTTLLSSPS